MRTVLSPSELESYRANGFLLIEDFLTAAELEQWRSAAEAAVDFRLGSLRQKQALGEVRTPLTTRLRGAADRLFGQRRAERLSYETRRWLRPLLAADGLTAVLDTNQGQPGSFYANVYTQVIGTSRDNDELRRLVRDVRLGAVVAQLTGWRGVRVYVDQSLFKLAHNNFTAWHLDAPFWSFYAPEALTMWLALDDATPDNGCMQYLPGSQRTARLDRNRSIGAEFNALFDLYPEWRKITPAVCSCRAGSAIFHSSLIAHAAGPNQTDSARRAYTISFMPEDAVFNGIRDVMPQEQFKSLRPGDRLDNEERYPVIWKAAHQVSQSHP